MAENLAEEIGGVIINADSMQIYREIPILSAQPTAEQMAKIPHFLYGIISVSEKFSVGKWLEYAEKEINKIRADGKTPIIVGGTGMYIKRLIDGVAYVPEIPSEIRKKAAELLKEMGNADFHSMLKEKDPEMGERLKPGDTQRMLRAWEVLHETGKSIAEWQKKPHRKFFDKEDFVGFFINPPREELYKRCDARFLKMLEVGAMDEAKKLSDMNLPKNLTGMKALGVPELISYINVEISLDEAIKKAQQSTRNYAKRQVTWFKNQMKDFREIKDYNEKTQLVI